MGGINFQINELFSGNLSIHFINIIFQEKNEKNITEAFKRIKNATFMQFGAGIIFRFGEDLFNGDTKRFIIKNRFTGQIMIESESESLKSFIVSNKTRLSEANLSKMDLSELNLDGADFMNADLRGTNLRRSSLIGADFRGADMENANLEDADLWRADLTGANLKNASLTGTQLGGSTYQPRIR